jgi:hypothetical protein
MPLRNSSPLPPLPWKDLSPTDPHLKNSRPPISKSWIHNWTVHAEIKPDCRHKKSHISKVSISKAWDFSERTSLNNPGHKSCISYADIRVTWNRSVRTNGFARIRQFQSLQSQYPGHTIKIEILKCFVSNFFVGRTRLKLHAFIVRAIFSSGLFTFCRLFASKLILGPDFYHIWSWYSLAFPDPRSSVSACRPRWLPFPLGTS